MWFVRAASLAKHPWRTEIAIGVGVYVLSAIVLVTGFEHSFMRAAVLAAGVALVLVIPGWCLTVLAFPIRDRIGADHSNDAPRALDIIERMTLAVIFSIVVTSGVVFVLSREVRAIGVPLTPRMLFGTLMAVSALLALGVWARLLPRARLHAAAAAVVVLGSYAAAWIGVPVTLKTIVLGVFALIIALTIASVSRRIAAIAIVRFPVLASFGRYAVIGAGNTVLDFTIYTTLTRGFPFWGKHILLANATSFIIVITWSFYWNKRWTFENRERRHAAQYVRFVLVTVVSLGIAESVLAIGVAFGVPDLMAKVIAGPLVILWNFTAYRRWAFGARPRKGV